MAQNTGWRNACKLSKIYLLLTQIPPSVWICALWQEKLSPHFFPFCWLLPLLWHRPKMKPQGWGFLTVSMGVWTDQTCSSQGTFCVTKIYILASCIQVGVRDLTSWPWSLVPKFLIHLKEFKSDLEVRGSMNLADYGPVVLQRVPGWIVHSKTLRSSCSFLCSPWYPRLPWGKVRNRVSQNENKKIAQSFHWCKKVSRAHKNISAL